MVAINGVCKTATVAQQESVSDTMIADDVRNGGSGTHKHNELARQVELECLYYVFLL